MKTVTLCGSMRFMEEMKSIAFELEVRHNMNVLQLIDVPGGIELSDAETEVLSRAHYEKINRSDAIYVVDINGYIGQAVRREIAYAEERGKEIIYHSLFTENT